MNPLNRNALKVGRLVAAEGFPEGMIVSEEVCYLEPLVKGHPIIKWACWTVESPNHHSLKKYLIVDWGRDGIIAWKPSKKTQPPRNAKLWFKRSGLESMIGQVNGKRKLFTYSLLTFALANKPSSKRRFFCLERLRQDRLFAYEGVQIN